MNECPRCGRKDITTETTTAPDGAVKSRKYRCQDCGPVKPGDARETVTTILAGLDAAVKAVLEEDDSCPACGSKAHPETAYNPDSKPVRVTCHACGYEVELNR